MRVFLTGATGFLGSHALDALLAAGHEVSALIRPGSDPWRVAHASGYRPVHGVIDGIEASLAEIRPEVVVHCAWGGVENAHRNDAAQLANVTDAATLVAAAKAVGARKFVGLGSQAEYGPRQATLSEAEPTTPTTLYGATKLAACHVTRVLCETNGLEWAWIRVFSSYGPRDNPSWLVPYLVATLRRREEPALTAAEQEWDYVYGPDAARAIVAVAERGDGLYNLGSGTATPLRRVVEAVRDAVDPALPLGFGKVPYRPDQVMYLRADTSRLRALGWTPQMALDQGLRETARWFLEHPDRLG